MTVSSPDPSGEYDWIVMDPAIDFAALYKEFDTVIMGRKTYELTTAQGGHGAIPGMTVLVFSRTLGPATYQGVRIVNDDPRDVVKALKAKPGRDIWLFGGGEMFRSLLTAGVVDTVEVAVMPVLLGSGIPLLPPGATTKLKLADQKTLPASGIVGAVVLDTRQHGPGAPDQLRQARKVPREEDGASDHEEVDHEVKEEALSARSALRLDRLRFHGVDLAQDLAAYNLGLDDRTGHCPAG